MRQALAAVLHLAIMGLAYLWLGIEGLVGFQIGMFAGWLLLGFGYGWWAGLNERIDLMVADLMQWIRDQRL